VFSEFEGYCKDKLNAANEGFLRQSYSRMHMKAIKYASLLAVADNPINPIISESHARWAINFLISGAAMFEKRVEAGDVGGDDFSREKVIYNKCLEFLSMPAEQVAKWQVSPATAGKGIVPKSYIQKAAGRHAAFRNHTLGSARALTDTLKTLEESGILHSLDKLELSELGMAGKSIAYRVIGKL
jgi:hypothetical protein